MSLLGILIGKKTGAHLGKKMVMVGGIILIAIGTKILLSHILA
jgi:putative Mn2+ efflux pump MntP